jgi:hypothetical protein
VLSAAPVQIQRANDAGGWTTVATTTVDAAGAFSIAFPVVPGTYRARIVAGKGWAVALSAELQVVKT